MAAESAFTWLLMLLGLRKRVQETLGEIVETDLAVAGAVARAYSLHDVEQYARMLEQRGETALAAEIRRQVALLVPAAGRPRPGVLPAVVHPPPPPVSPPLLAAPQQTAPQPALPPAGQVKRKPGRPPKNPAAPPPAGPSP